MQLAAVDRPSATPRLLDRPRGANRGRCSSPACRRRSGPARYDRTSRLGHRGEEHLAGGGRMKRRTLAASGEGPNLVGPVDLVDEDDAVAVADREVDALAGRRHQFGHHPPRLITDVDGVEDPRPELEQPDPEAVAARDGILPQPPDPLERSGQPPAGASIDAHRRGEPGGRDPALGRPRSRGRPRHVRRSGGRALAPLARHRTRARLAPLAIQRPGVARRFCHRVECRRYRNTIANPAQAGMTHNEGR